jgi:uncharacterized repeat protein (TIGR04052 family)
VEVRIPFEARVGAVPFVAGESFDGVGTSAARVRFDDFRLYLHEPNLVFGDGASSPLELVQDGVWQDGRVALLDFEDARSDGGTRAMNTELLVRASSDDLARAVGFSFTVGVPEARNHVNVDLAPSPLNLTSMFWTWTTGYKFVRIEGTNGGGRPILTHLGAAPCMTGASCTTEPVALTGALATHKVVLDLAALFAAVDLATSSGCMSGSGNPDCLRIEPAAGMRSASLQTLFRFEVR